MVRNVLNAFAEGSRVDALQNPRRIDSEGTWLGHAGCHRAVQRSFRQTQHSTM